MTSRADAIAILRRRLLHLEERLAARTASATTTTEYRGSSYDRAEISAIRLAIKELEERD